LHNPSGAQGLLALERPVDRSVLGVFLSVSVSRTNQLQNGVEKHLFYRITIQSQAPQASELLPSGEQGGPHTFFFYSSGGWLPTRRRWLSQLVGRRFRLAPCLRQTTAFVALHFGSSLQPRATESTLTPLGSSVTDGMGFATRCVPKACRLYNPKES
jgi:hypothetical protein